ncbi:MAG: TolC family protein [Candidatus Eremiobacteraeota bacterium]|nr:TolC family protein [Candidatus Eremiobacteraeota bacterium]
MKSVVLLLAIAGMPIVSQAQNAPSVLSLSEALNQANANNPDILAARRGIDVARAALVQAAALPLQAQAGSGVTQDVPLGLGTLQTFAAGATQQFSPTIGAQRQVAGAGVQIAQAQFASTERDIDQRVVTAYYSLGSAQAVVAATQQSVTNAAQLEKSARLRAKVGAVGNFEVLRAAVELRRAQTDLLRAQANQRTADIGLNVLLGRAELTPTSAILSVSSADSSDVNGLFERAEQIDPFLAQFRAAIAQSIAQARVARLQRAPSVAVSGGFLFQRASGSGVFSRGPTAGVSLSLPLLDYGTIRGAVLEAQARESVAEAQLLGRNAQLHAQLSQAAADIESARARLSFSRASLTQAQEGLRLAQFGYQQGALGVLDVLSARNELAAAQSEVTQASADLGAAVARLQLIVGAPVLP